MSKKTITSKTYKVTFFILFITVLKGCISYDTAIVYKKNYDQGKSNKLLFNGFYQTEKETTGNYLSPIYFYADGSVIFSGLIKDTIELKKITGLSPKGMWGFWGNYKIINDTIVIETFPANINTFNQDRYLVKGIIKDNKISFFEEINRKGARGRMNETINFINFKTKPDSTANWIRKKRKYNR